MSSDMSLTSVPLTVIVAATKSNGIGKNGGLPWPMLKKEMAYFARVTKRVPQPRHGPSKSVTSEAQQKNVVIMGRKTWESIPPKLRPLKERTNIVISTQSREQLHIDSQDVIVADSIQTGLQALETKVTQNEALSPGRAYIIGGTTIYRAALDLPQTSSILLTRISQDFDCDTHFPVDPSHDEHWRRASREELESFVNEDIPAGMMAEGEGDAEVQYEFQLYEKV